MNLENVYIKQFILILLFGLFTDLVHCDPFITDSPDNNIVWTNIKDLEVEGRGWKESPLFYRRLPAQAEKTVPPGVWSLSEHTAGMYVRFITDAVTIKARWNLTEESLSMPHFAATGVSGLDLYVKTKEDSWRWLGVGKPISFPKNSDVLVEGMPKGEREYLLYLPLYNGVSSVEIGVPKESRLEKAPSRKGKPIIFYGTSITQGGCASRPGMCTTAILGRRLDLEIINLGFSGSGRMEPALAELLAELDPLIYFIDCLPNLQADEVATRVEPFVQILRKARPDIPIVLVEGVTYNDAFLRETRDLRNSQSRIALRNAYENLLNSGVRHLFYQVAEGQLGFDGEATVDGTHPTDLGFMRQADAYQPLLESILHEEVTKVTKVKSD